MIRFVKTTLRVKEEISSISIRLSHIFRGNGNIIRNKR